MLVSLAIVALVLIAAWRLGSLALRLAGVVVALVGLIVLATGGDGLAGVVAVLLGCVAWFAGHWLYAFRHHEYRGALAERVFLQVLPARLDPTRGWVVPTPDAEPSGAQLEQRRRRRPSEL